MTIRISITENERLGDVLEQLVQRGLVFHAKIVGNEWLIELTGGF